MAMPKVFFFKQKTAYEISTCLEFRRVLFRSLFVSDAQTGARLSGAVANLHVEPLAGGPEQPPDMSRSIALGYAGRKAPDYMGAPEGWRFPEADVEADLDGRADFWVALPGWCRLT